LVERHGWGRRSRRINTRRRRRSEKRRMNRNRRYKNNKDLGLLGRGVREGGEQGEKEEDWE
jgi:hypothetical protein